MTRLPKILFAGFAVLLAGMVQARADVTIGVAGPMTGSNAAFGEQLKRGVDKAVLDLNAKGGVLKQKVIVTPGDDACDPKQAVSVANSMVGKKVAAVIGHFCSGSSIPASSVYEESNIVQISPASTNPTFTERGLANTFRVCGRDDAQGPTAAKYVLANLKGKKIAVVDDKSTYGKGLADEFKKALNAGGATEVLHDQVTAGEKDFSALVTKVKQAGADVLYYGGYDAEAALIVRQMHDQGLKTILMGGDALVTQEFWAVTGPSGEGTLMTFGPDATKNPADAELVKWFRDNKYEPEGYTLYAYAAVQAWAQAAEKAGSVAGTKVEAALKADQFETAIGKIGFDKKGDVTAPGYLIYEWKAGKYDYAAHNPGT